MDNKLIIPEIQKKYAIKLHRNATLDSTSSSLKLQKMKIYDGLTPLVNITKNTSIKQILDFPVFMSLYTNNVKKKEKEEKKRTIPNGKLILKDVKKFNVKNLLIQSQNDNKKELILPIAKNVLSRNQNGSANNILSPIQSNIKNYLLQIKKFSLQSSRNISKPKLKKINPNKLSKLTQRNIPSINILKAKKLEKIKNSIKTYELNITEINNKKYTFGGLNFNLNNNINEINNKLQNENNDNKLMEDNKNSNIENEKNSVIINNKLETENKQKENNIVNNDNVNKNNSKQKKELEKNLKLDIDNKAKKVKKLLNKGDNINDNIKQNNSDINNIKKDNNLKGIKENNNKNIILDIKQIKTLELKKDKNNIEELNLASSGKEDESSYRNNKFSIKFQDKKINKIYSKVKFLNKINKELTEHLINKRINSKIFSQKKSLLTNIKDVIEKSINKEDSKIIKHNSQFLSQAEINSLMSIYIKEIFLDKSKLKLYKETYIYLFSGNIKNKFNCIIGCVTRDYIFEKYETKLSLQNNNKLNEKDEGNLIKNFKQDKKINILKRHNTYRHINNNETNNNNSEHFSVDKTKNIKLNLEKYLCNFIIIQEFILKSLPFYKENFIRFINYHRNYKGFSRRNINFRSFDRNISKKYNRFSNFEELNKKNSFNSLPFRDGSRRRRDRRTGSVLNFENIKQTLRIQSLQKTELRESNFSVLKQKNFFKKLHTNNEIFFSDKESNKSLEKEKPEVNEGDKQLESIYFELTKALFDGKFRNFKNIYLKNKKYIDINQPLLEGNTLLILAVREGNYQITKFLCEENADINSQNSEGNTALHYAIGKQFFSLADILTIHGAKEDLQNLKGLSPWDCIEHNVD